MTIPCQDTVRINPFFKKNILNFWKEWICMIMQYLNLSKKAER